MVWGRIFESEIPRSNDSAHVLKSMLTGGSKLAIWY